MRCSIPRVRLLSLAGDLVTPLQEWLGDADRSARRVVSGQTWETHRELNEALQSAKDRIGEATDEFEGIWNCGFEEGDFTMEQLTKLCDDAEESVNQAKPSLEGVQKLNSSLAPTP